MLQYLRWVVAVSRAEIDACYCRDMYYGNPLFPVKRCAFSARRTMYEEGIYSTRVLTKDLTWADSPPSIPPKSPLRDIHPALRPARSSRNDLNIITPTNVDDEYRPRQDLIEEIVRSLEPLWPPLHTGISDEALSSSGAVSSRSRSSSIYSR